VLPAPPGSGDRHLFGDRFRGGERSLREFAAAAAATQTLLTLFTRRLPGEDCNRPAPRASLLAKCGVAPGVGFGVVRFGADRGEVDALLRGLSTGFSVSRSTFRSTKGLTSRCVSFGMVVDSTTVASPSRSSIGYQLGTPRS